jgi:VCBS repeat protein/FG-GAP repeat protein
VAGPSVPFPPARGPRRDTVGGGTDPIVGGPGIITMAVGSFDSVSGVTSVTSTFGADDYSLQLNANVFSTPICSGGGTPAQCVGWQQFIFSNGQCGTIGNPIPCAFMQYWLIGWGSTTCPAGGWMYFNNNGDDECYMSSNAVFPPRQTIANLGNLSLTAKATPEGLDAVIFSSGSNAYTVQANDNVLELAAGWTAFEYNLVGDCCGNPATLNSGSSMVVRMSVDNASPSAPSCDSASFGGYTAETNSLYLQPASGTPTKGTLPAIVFTQSSDVTSTSPCSSAVAVPAAATSPPPPTALPPPNLVSCNDFVAAWTASPGATGYFLDLARDAAFTNFIYDNLNEGNITAIDIGGFSPNTTYYYRVRAYNSSGTSANSNTISVHTAAIVSHDFNCDGKSDIVWRNTDGEYVIWAMNGAAVLETAYDTVVPTSWSVVGQRDFGPNGSSNAGVLWRNSDGDMSIWYQGCWCVTASLGNIPTSWSVAGTGDFNGDGQGDILWRNANGDTSIWLMNGAQALAGVDLGGVPTSWAIVGTGDFNSDGKADILWRNTNGDTSIWLMTGTGTHVQVLSTADLGGVPTSWSVAGTGDFDGDGKYDILWHNSNGDTSIWLMNGTTVSSATDLGLIPPSWNVAVTGDFNGDGHSDILWRNTNGDTSIWLMTSNGTQVKVMSTTDLGIVPTSWVIQGAGAD